MNILDRLKAWRATRKQIRSLNKLLSAAKAASKKNAQEPKLQPRHFQFILTNVDDADPAQLPESIAKVATTILEQGVPLGSIECSLMVTILGVPFAEMDSEELRMKIVTTLLRQHGNLIRIAHGQCNAMAGLYGAEKRLTYGGIIPQFSATLKRLLDTEFGTAIEI